VAILFGILITLPGPDFFLRMLPNFYNCRLLQDFSFEENDKQLLPDHPWHRDHVVLNQN